MVHLNPARNPRRHHKHFHMTGQRNGHSGNVFRSVIEDKSYTMSTVSMFFIQIPNRIVILTVFDIDPGILSNGSEVIPRPARRLNLHANEGYEYIFLKLFFLP